jgi:hypothetical protein
MAKKEEAIFVQIDDQIIELTGSDKEDFILDRQVREELAKSAELEYQTKQDSRQSALKKLGEIAGLTKEELASIL